jgi:hypothetical protein
MVKHLDHMRFDPLRNVLAGDMLSWADGADDANAPAFVLVPPTVLCCDGILGQEVSWDDCLWGTINLTEPA